jgi:hypothetical protein
MMQENNKQTIEAIGAALWSAHLEQVCPTGFKPFFVMDQTARTGP